MDLWWHHCYQIVFYLITIATITIDPTFVIPPQLGSIPFRGRPTVRHDLQSRLCWRNEGCQYIANHAMTMGMDAQDSLAGMENLTPQNKNKDIGNLNRHTSSGHEVKVNGCSWWPCPLFDGSQHVLWPCSLTVAGGVCQAMTTTAFTSSCQVN